jgi:hypothetical protein
MQNRAQALREELAKALKDFGRSLKCRIGADTVLKVYRAGQPAAPTAPVGTLRCRSAPLGTDVGTYSAGAVLLPSAPVLRRGTTVDSVVGFGTAHIRGQLMVTFRALKGPGIESAWVSTVVRTCSNHAPVAVPNMQSRETELVHM